MVTILSSCGIYPDRALRNVVLPAPVPPDTIILYPDTTSFLRNSATSVVIEPSCRSLSMVIPSFGNFLIVMTQPPRLTGGRTTLTLDPSFSLASTIGNDSFTSLLHSATICWITDFSLSSLSNVLS